MPVGGDCGCGVVPEQSLGPAWQAQEWMWTLAESLLARMLVTRGTRQHGTRSELLGLLQRQRKGRWVFKMLP
eukprot:6476515-Amphidinium_carterae.1